MNLLGVYDNVNDAIDAAFDAQKELETKYSTEDRNRFINKIKEKFLEIVNEETIAEFQETGYGRLDEKLIKNYFSIQGNPDATYLNTKVMASSQGLTVEYAAPYGLVGALTPVTNGLVTVACNAMTMIAAGNSVVFNCHPAAKEAGMKAVSLVNEAMKEENGPVNIATTVTNPNKDSLDVILKSDKVKLLIGTGGEEMVQLLLSSPKKVIAAGPGNPPTIIDETADVTKAARALYQNVPFENNMLCITEKVAFVVESVFDEFVQEMVSAGARSLTEKEVDAVTQTALIKGESQHHYNANKKFIGKDANFILKESGVTPSDFDLKLAIALVDNDHPLVSCEQMMPVFPIVKCKDFSEAMERAILAERGFRHSAAIWSKDITRVTEFGKKIGTTCFVSNGCTVAATGMGGTGEGSATIATGTGEGFTDPNSFTRVRRMALGDGNGYII